MEVWREAKRNYAAMLSVALQPGSGIDRGSELFLRQKLANAESKIAQYRRDPLQAAGYGALKATRDVAAHDLAEMRKEVKEAGEKAKKKKKKDKKKKEKKDKKDQKEKGSKKGKKKQERAEGNEMADAEPPPARAGAGAASVDH